MKTSQKIVNFLQKNGATSIDELSLKLKLSRQYIHQVIKILVDNNTLTKMGTAPHVYYSLAQKNLEQTEIIPYTKEVFLQEHFMLIDALGNKLEGLRAMRYWCENQHLPLLKTIDEYIETRKKYLAYYDSYHLIDGLSKLKNTKGISEIGLDELYYFDFYAIERFGKTRLGCLMHYAKQGQNTKLMQQVVDEIRNRLSNLVHQKHVDALLFVPPTIKRKVQIMDFFEKKLDLKLPKIKVKKISNEIVIPQKALSKLFERIANAKNTFVIPDQARQDTVLMIDDAVGSGATMNEIALKMKKQKVAKKIIGVSISGSFKGFDVISEL
jgi:hypothetical protein